MSLPTIIVEVGFTAGPGTADYLHLDDAGRGKLGTGTLAPDNIFQDVSAYVMALEIVRGASRVEHPIIRYEAGTCTIELKNTDRRFDPTYTTGPYSAGGVSQVVPMVAVRVRATWNSVTYNLFRGFADSWDISYAKGPNDPNYSKCVLHATDAFKVVGNYERVAVSAVGAGEDSGARINRILDGISWPATDRVIAVGDSTLQSTTLAGDVMTELFLVQDTDLAELYIDGSGNVFYRNQNALQEDTRSNTSQATFGDSGAELPYFDIELVYDDTSLVNRALIARTGGTQQQADDATSQAKYLVRTHERTDLLFQTDTKSLSYAQFTVYVNKDAELRFGRIIIAANRDEANLFPQVLGRLIGDRITIKRRPPGGGTIQRDVFIRGITHRMSVRDQTWFTDFTLESATKFQFLTLDHSTLGKLDNNALAW